MQFVHNPTIHLKKGKLWGFDVQHILLSIGVLVVCNVLLGFFDLPLFISWVAGLSSLVILRIVSSGKKAGHLGFFIQWLSQSHIFLGARRSHKRSNV